MQQIKSYLEGKGLHATKEIPTRLDIIIFNTYNNTLILIINLTIRIQINYRGILKTALGDTIDNKLHCLKCTN